MSKKESSITLQCFSLSFLLLLLLPSTPLKHGTFAQFLALFEKQFSTSLIDPFARRIYQDLYDDLNAHF